MRTKPAYVVLASFYIELALKKLLRTDTFLFCWVIGGIDEDYKGEALPY